VVLRFATLALLLVATVAVAVPAPPRAKGAQSSASPAKTLPKTDDERDPYDLDDPDSVDQSDGSDYEDPNEPPPDEVQTISNANYVVLPGTNKDVKRLEMKAPSLPDLSPYTSAAARAKVVRAPAGRASVGSMLTELSFNSFKGHDERLREWAMRQSSLPKQ